MMIQKYEDWMRPQVVALFNAEYGMAEGEFDKLFLNFYEHSFQLKQCIRIVALDDKTVAGFQSFFYWPICFEGKILRSYQSGNSLVHPSYRGKGLFAGMLNFIDDPANGFDCELLIGFPVEASYNSFMRNKWLNPFNLQWYVKPLSPVLSLLSSPEEKLKRHFPDRKKIDFHADKSVVYVQQSAAFDDYRFAYEKGDFYRFLFEQHGKSALFEMKAQRRKKIIKELVIGKFLASHGDEEFLTQAFSALSKAVKRAASFSILSVAVNPNTATLVSALSKNGFRMIDKKIYFIAKGRLASSISDWSNWWMFRSDIDTW